MLLKGLPVFLLLGIVSPLFSQTGLYQVNVGITVGNGGALYVAGDYQTNTNVNNTGVITIEGNLNNQGSTDIFENQTGTVILSGTTNQQIQSSESWAFHKLILNKTSGTVYLNCNIEVDSLLTFNGGNLFIDTYHIDLGVTGSLFGENENSHIYATTGTVRARRSLLSPLGTDDIAGVGLYIHSPLQNFGMTDIVRGHNSIPEAGNGSIARWFYVKPSVAAPTESVAIHYFDTDGMVDEESLQFYSRKAGSTIYFPNGGASNISTNQASSTFFPLLEEYYITLAPVSNNSTCDPSHPDYVESVFLAPTIVTEEDTVYFVNLSTPTPGKVKNIWNTGDGYSFGTEDVLHVYADSGTYNASLIVSNNVCFAASSKKVIVRKNSVRYTASPVVSDLINSFIYYPNPIETSLNWYLDFTDVYPSVITLLDIYGRTIFVKSYHQQRIEDHHDFSLLPAGLYLLKLEVLGRMYTYRIVKI